MCTCVVRTQCESGNETETDCMFFFLQPFYVLPVFLLLLFQPLHLHTNHQSCHSISILLGEYMVFLKKTKKEGGADSGFSIFNSYMSVAFAGWSRSTKGEERSPLTSETYTLNHFYYPTEFMSPGHLFQLLGPLTVKDQELAPYNTVYHCRLGHFYAQIPLQPNFRH